MKDRQIEWLGQKKIKLESISMPSGFAGRKKMPHVQELARSIARLGGRPMNLPIVLQLSDKRVPITGRDRLAAAAVNKDATVLVELVKCGEVDAELMEIDENLQRRRGDDYDKLIARRVELTTEIVKEAEAAAPAVEVDPEVPAKKGRHTSAKGKAREIVAKATGKSPEAVRQAEKRHKAKVEGKPAKVKKEKPGEVAAPEDLTKSPFPFVETWDLVVDDATRDREAPGLRKVQASLDDVSKHLDAALRALSGMKNATVAEQTAYTRCYTSVQTAADIVRRAYPGALCPYCKWVPTRRKVCTGCGGSGFVAKDSLEALPSVLRLRGPEAMVPDLAGGFMPLADAMHGASKAPVPTGRRKLTIETADGQTLSGE